MGNTKRMIPPAKPIPLSQAVAVGDGAVVSRVLLKNSAGNVTLFAFDAGQEISEHTTAYDALLQVIEGEAQVTIGGTLYPVSTGHIILLPAKIPHAVAAPVRFKMLLTMLRPADTAGS